MLVSDIGYAFLFEVLRKCSEIIVGMVAQPCESASRTGQLPQTCPPRPHLANPPHLLPGQQLCKKAPHVSWHQRDGPGGSGPGAPGPGALLSDVKLGPWTCGGMESAV